MVLIHTLVSLMLLSTSTWGGDIARSTHGEIQTPEFFGSHLSDFKYNPYLFKLNLIEEKLRNNYVELHINDEFFDLSEFMSDELYHGLACPDNSFMEKYDYIRFLNRLQTMSYLFQSLREHEYTMNRLDITNTCAINWDQVLSKCSPASSEMKLFVKNSKTSFKSLSRIKAPFQKNLKQNRRDWIAKVSKKNSRSISSAQLHEYCQKNNCGKLNIKKVANSMQSICRREKDMFESICSERDSLYGLSLIPEAYQLIISSSGLRGIDKDGLGAGCVKRFILQNKNLEKESPFLKTIFSTLYEYNLNEAPQNPQGKLFTMGALREFTEKGLESVFQKDVEVVVPKKVTVVKTELPKPSFKEITLPKFIKKKKKKRVDPPRKAPKLQPKIRKTSFLISCEVREQFSLDFVDVDMEKFKRDYVFTNSEKEKLLPVVEQFSSVKALRSMKKLDKLGSKSAPLPLKFLKFLIDEKMNQNLFNINLVLGNSFYVQNDIDKTDINPVYIELLFDSSSGSIWRIKVLNEVN